MAKKSKADWRVATLDAETDPFKFGGTIEPFVWGFYDEDGAFTYFWGDAQEIAASLIEFLKDKENYIIYAHNGGKFDFFFLLDYLDSEIFIINGRIAKATLFNGQIELRDSWLIYPMSLDKYSKLDIDYSKMERGVRDIHKNEIIRYLHRDCQALHELMKSFVDRFGPALTLSSVSLKELKNTGYEVSRTTENFDSKFRPYFFGGRVQCFKTGSFYGDYDYVDINSAYPWAMKFKHWYGNKVNEHRKIPEWENGSWFAKISAVSNGCLPYRAEKLYFPDDEKVRDYYASGWEINKGLETGTLHIKKVHTCYRPAQLASMEAYVDKWMGIRWQAKSDGDAILVLQSKLLANGGYGKLAQDGRKYEKFCIVPFGGWPETSEEIKKKIKSNPDKAERFCWQPYSDIENKYSIFHRSDPQDLFYNVATAASITGFVRAYMWESLLNSEEPLYCDTDSIICRRFNGDVGKALGQWDKEAHVVEAHIAQRKMYGLMCREIDDSGTIKLVPKVASKGVRIDFDTLKQAMEDGAIYTYLKESPAYSLKHGARYLPKKIDFTNVAKNAINTPPEMET